MKIYEVLQDVTNHKPSQYGDVKMLEWLSALDGQVWEDLLSRYGVPAPALPYREQMMNVQLAVPFPHDQLYMTYLSAQIDYMNAEYERYNNGMMMFNAQLQAFYDAYTRTHRRAGAQIKGVKAL